MATMGFKWSGIGAAPQVMEALSDGGDDFVAGDLVILASGKATIITSDQTVFGVALKACGTSTTTKIPIQVITPDSIWIAAADTTTATTNVNEDYGLNITTNSMSVDIGDTTTTTVRIEQLDSRDGAAATGRVYVRFLSARLKEAI